MGRGVEGPQLSLASKHSPSHTCDSSRSRSTGERGRGERRGEGGARRGVRRGFSVPPSSPRCSRVPLLPPRGSSAAVSSSPGLSLIILGGGGRRGGGRGGGGGGPGAGAVLSTGSGGGRGEQVRESGSGEQVREGGVGVDGRDNEGGGDKLLRRPHCSRFSLLLRGGGGGEAWAGPNFSPGLFSFRKRQNQNKSINLYSGIQ